MFKPYLYVSSLALFVSCFSINGVNSPIALAQSLQEPASPDTGTPEGQQGVGGTRPQTSCPDTGSQHLIALVQGRGQDITRSKNPTIWVYIPYDRKDISYLEFSLHDRALSQTLYRTALEVSETPGLIKIPIPYELAPNSTYRWYFKLYCQPHKPGENTKYYYLQNWLKYQPNFPEELSWYDRISEVGARYFAEPENATLGEEWRQLLNALTLPEWLWEKPFANSTSVPPYDSP